MSARCVRLGLIGLGRWGVNYARTINSTSGVSLYAIATKNQRSVEFDVAFHTQNWRDLLGLAELDGVIIACNPELYYDIASSFLNKGLPVIIEKPVCLKTDHCFSLKEISLRNNVPCLVGYTHLYSSAYRFLKKKVHEIGVPLMINSVGLSDGPFRNNVDVLWDWGSHDVAMCLDFLGELPSKIEATREENDIEKSNACNYALSFNFPSGVRFTSKFGNISKKKERLFCVELDKARWCYDGLTHSVSHLTNEAGEYIDATFDNLPLANLVNEFAAMVRNQEGYHEGLDLAINVTRVLNVAECKINQ